jgi:signal transduction histidine kinase
MDLQSQASLIAALLCAALAANVLLRSRKRKVHWAYSFFAGTVALWYLSSFFRRIFPEPIWERLNLGCGVLVPLAAVQFFRLFADDGDRRMARLSRAAVAVAALILVAILTPQYDHIAVGAATFAYTVVFFPTSLFVLYRRVRSTSSRFERARLRYLTLVGGLGGLFTLLDYAPYFGVEIPPVGTVLILVFLYMLLQSITRHRLMDLYELTGRLGVLTALSFMLATMLWGMVRLTGERFFLHSVISAVVVLLLFDPVRSKVADWISQVIFRERYDFERSITALRRRVAHAFEISDLCRVLLAGVEESRRITHAGLYLADADRHGFHLAGHLGPEPPARVEMAPARPLLDRLGLDTPLVLENLERELAELRDTGEDREAETLYEVVQTMKALFATLCLPIAGDNGLYGFLVVKDERVRDAFAPEEVQLLLGLATQTAITLENSSLYQEMKERDRLAALGEMAAGLAHEIRNPLGAIKAAAQYLAEPGGETEHPNAEFLDIIVEETDRLDRVVSAFLDFARPAKGHPAPVDVKGAVQRTMQLLGPELEAAGCAWSLEVDTSLPLVRIDVEQLRQVLINLVKNAVQAMPHEGEVKVLLTRRVRASPGGGPRTWVQLRVTDSGPGIPEDILPKLFVPFVTTKDRGTGLGLAISQRIVNASGGRIEVRTQVGRGTTFIIHLPAESEAPASAGLYSAAPSESPASVGSRGMKRLEPPAVADEVESGSTTSR